MLTFCLGERGALVSFLGGESTFEAEAVGNGPGSNFGRNRPKIAKTKIHLVSLDGDIHGPRPCTCIGSRRASGSSAGGAARAFLWLAGRASSGRPKQGTGARGPY